MNCFVSQFEFPSRDDESNGGVQDTLQDQELILSKITKQAEQSQDAEIAASPFVYLMNVTKM